MKVGLKNFVLFWPNWNNYRYQVNDWHSKGIPFKDHLYVSEVHPLTGAEFCEREYEGHAFKVFSIFSNTTLCPFFGFQRIA